MIGTEKFEDLQVVILAGGKGLRLNEQTINKPKPLIKVANEPLLEHVIKMFKAHQLKTFVISTGYKRELIDDYIKKKKGEEITTTFTGLEANTGGRIKNLGLENKKEVGEDFFVSYTDIISNIDLYDMYLTHKKNNNLVTMATTNEPSRYGEPIIRNNKVISFTEKPVTKMINAGVYIVNKQAIKLIKNYKTSWEEEVLPLLAKNGHLGAYHHKGFWRSIDTRKDQKEVEEILINKNRRIDEWKKNSHQGS